MAPARSTSKSDCRWIGAVVVDSRSNRRVTVSAKSEAEAKRKLSEKQREIARHGVPAAGSAKATGGGHLL